MQAELVDIIEVGNSLGEGVTWDPRTGHVWWTDIQESKLYCLHFETKALDVFDLPERLGAFGFTDDPATFIGAFATGFYLFEPETGTRTLIEKLYEHTAGIRLNDGRLDRQGRFWAGSMVEDASAAGAEQGALYSVAGGVVRKHFGGVQISNGLGWNKAGDSMYFADTPAKSIQRFDFDVALGRPEQATAFAAPVGQAGADGGTVDADDHYWSAQWGTGQAVRYTPEGAVDHIVRVGAPHVSCLEYGGPALDYLFVTTAKWEMGEAALKQYPQAGHLFIYKTDVKGVALTKFYSLS